MESTLSAAYNDLAGDVGFFLGFSRGLANGETAWDAYQQRSIDRSLKGGLRKVYHCGYDWSFTKPTIQLSLITATTVLPLPDDYGGLEGPRIQISGPTGQTWWALDIVGAGMVYEKQNQYPGTTGRPMLCCIEPIKGTGPQAGQRFQLNFFPTADQTYTLKLRYYVLPDYLGGSFPYPLGGAAHAETFLEACLSVAEKILDDASDIHEAEFQKLLAQSQDLDRRQKPQSLGYCGDSSDQLHNRPYRNHYGDTISYMGTTY